MKATREGRSVDTHGGRDGDAGFPTVRPRATADPGGADRVGWCRRLSRSGIVRTLVEAIDADVQAKIRDSEPDPAAAMQALIDDAIRPIAANPELRQRILELRAEHDRVIDEVSVDNLVDARGVVDIARARSIVDSWTAYLEKHRDEITAIQLMTEARERRISFSDIRNSPTASDDHHITGRLN